MSELAMPMQTEYSPIIVAVGANLPSIEGAARETVSKAAELLEASGLQVIAHSRLYASPADPPSDQPDYVNAVLLIETGLGAAALLALLHEIEAGQGRRRRTVNEARPLDLDLIDYRGQVSNGGVERNGLPLPVLPHPRAHLRSFVLRPLFDVAPKWRHPVSGRSVGELIAELPPGMDTATALS